jgi:hypothetical protein
MVLTNEPLNLVFTIDLLILCVFNGEFQPWPSFIANDSVEMARTSLQPVVLLEIFL